MTANALTALVELNLEVFFMWMLGMGGVLLLWCIQIYMQSKTFTQAVQEMNISMREDITKRISRYSYENFEKNAEGSYVSWLTNDINTINSYGFHTLSVVVTQIFTILFSVSAIVYFHYSILFTVSGLVLLVLGTPRIFSRKLNEAMGEVTKTNENVTTQIGDVMNGYSSLFMMNLRTFIVSKTKEVSGELAEKKVDYGKKAGLMSASTNGISLLSQVIVIAQTGYLYAQNLVPIGAMNGTQYFAANIFASLTGLSANLIEMKTVTPIFEKFESIEIDGKNKASIDEFNESLRLDKVSFTYPKMSSPVLNKQSFEFKKNKKYALLGSSGKGKSTILNLLSGKLKNYDGKIYIDGLDYKKLNLDSVRDQIIYLEQSPHIFNLSIRENIDLTQRATEEEMDQALKRSGLNEFISSLPNGLDTEIETNGKNLSGGQRQRIALARGLITGKTIVLFDEATSSIDTRSAKKIEEDIINSLELTVILVTHHLRENVKGKIDEIIYL